MREQWLIDSEEKLDNFISRMRDVVIGEYGFLVKMSDGQRTSKQNNSMHLYFDLLAKALNDAGLEIHMEYLGKTIEAPWTQHAVKERLWLPIMEAETGKTSTAKLERSEVSAIYDILHRYLAEAHGIFVAFPDRFGR